MPPSDGKENIDSILFHPYQLNYEPTPMNIQLLLRSLPSSRSRSTTNDRGRSMFNYSDWNIIPCAFLFFRFTLSPPSPRSTQLVWHLFASFLATNTASQSIYLRSINHPANLTRPVVRVHSFRGASFWQFIGNASSPSPIHSELFNRSSLLLARHFLLSSIRSAITHSRSERPPRSVAWESLSLSVTIECTSRKIIFIFIRFCPRTWRFTRLITPTAPLEDKSTLYRHHPQ